MNVKNWISGVMLASIWAMSAQAAGIDRSGLVAALDAALSDADPQRLESLLAENFQPHGHTGDMFRKPLTRELFVAEMLGLSRTLAGFSRVSEILVSDSETLSLQVTQTGRHTQPYLAQPASGNQLAVKTLEVWTLNANGRFTGVWRQSDDLSTLRQMTSWQPASSGLTPSARARELAHFPPGVFLESIIADQDGNLYFTQLMSGSIHKLAPDGSLSSFAELPVGSAGDIPEGVMCLVLDADGMMFVTVMAPGKPEHGVWQIDQQGRSRHFAALPPTVLPNGLARDSEGVLYVADSGEGGIWKIDPPSREATLWYEGELLRRRPYLGIYPPANGLQFWNGSLYASNSDRALIVRIPVEKGLAGTAVVHAQEVGGDDFAIDQDGTLYVTTHPYNSVIRVDHDGASTLIAGPEQGMVGPTAAVFAQRDGQRGLFVVTDGGLFSPLPDRPLRPAVVELDLSGL